MNFIINYTYAYFRVVLTEINFKAFFIFFSNTFEINKNYIIKIIKNSFYFRNSICWYISSQTLSILYTILTFRFTTLR